MIPRKFVAATSREALHKVREALGDEAIILSNKQIPGGVEIIAVSEHEMDAFAHEAHTGAYQEETYPSEFSPSPWPYETKQGIGAASHYQHWENVSWNPYTDEQSSFGRENDSQGAHPLSHLNHYWQSPAPAMAEPAAAPRPMERPAQPLPDWMTHRQTSSASTNASFSNAKVQPDFRASSQETYPGKQQQIRNPSYPAHSSPFPSANGGRPASREQAVSTSRPVSNKPVSPSGYPESSAPSKREEQIRHREDRLPEDRAGAKKETGRLKEAPSSDSIPVSHFHNLSRANASKSQESQASPPKKPSFPSSQSSLNSLSSSALPDDANIQHELKLLRSMLEGQLAGFAWNELSQRSPLHLTLMRWMLGAGISPVLAREMLEILNPTKDIMDAMGQVRQHLARRIDCMPTGDDIIDKGGIYALVGTTGVGKTTTVAKLAARCTLKHGPQHVALLTTDSYRIGAHDQLKAYGRILSVPVYGIRDESDLMSALNDLASRRLLLIDTIGMSQRDKRLVEQIALLGRQGGKVQQLLLIAANAQASTLEDIVRAYGSTHIAGVIMSKMDEAAQIGSVLDILIRHRLRLCYYTDGQRVPEDLHLPDAKTLIDRAFQDHMGESPLALNEREYPLIWK